VLDVHSYSVYNIIFSEHVVLHNSARGDSYLVQAEFRAAIPRTV